MNSKEYVQKIKKESLQISMIVMTYCNSQIVQLQLIWIEP
jgi:hypothetical protein